MKLKINWIEISGIRNFGLNQRFNFTDNTLYSVLGINKDDGGSNASGKTSFIISIPLLIFGPSAIKGISTAELKNRYLGIQSRVIGSISVDGAELIIDRIIGGKLKIKFGDNAWEDGKVDDIQARIQDIIKISSDQFLALSHKAQGEYGGFLLMTDAKKKEFLSSFFDVSWIDDISKECKIELTQKTNEYNSILGKIASYQDDGSLKKNLEESEKEFNYYSSDEFISKIANLDNNIETKNKLLASIDQQLNNFIPENTPDYEKWLKVKADTSEVLNKRIENLKIKDKEIGLKNLEISNNIEALNNILKTPIMVPEELKKKLTMIKKALSNAIDLKNSNNKKEVMISMMKKDLKNKNETLLSKEREIASIKDNVCVVCNQIIHDDTNIKLKQKLQENYNKLVLEIEALKENIAAHEKQIETVKVTDQEIETLKGMEYKAQANIDEFIKANNREDIRAQIGELENKIASGATVLELMMKEIEGLKNEIKNADYNLNKCVNDQKNQLRSTINILTSDLQSLKIQKSSILDKKELAQTLLNKYKKLLNENMEKLAKAESDSNKVKEDIRVLEETAKVLSRNGFIGYIFDSILEDLNSEINNNLKNIPNARKFSLQFSPDKVAKTTDSVSKSIVYQIFCGNKEVSFNSCSGGEKLSIIISVDEALDTVLSRRLGASIGWKILDEQLGWIDENSKESILEFFKSKTSEKSYIIVDHASEFNASIDNQIVIIKENEIAKFQ